MRSLIVTAALLMLAMPAAAAEEMQATFSAPVDRVWNVTESVLKSLGWEIDKSDRSVGWIVTKYRRVEGEEYGVYAKGTRHRLRLTMQQAGAGTTAVSVNRTVSKHERILWIDKDEPLLTTDRTVEQELLTAIRRAL